MKIEGIKTDNVVIEITEDERKTLVIEFLREKFDLASTHCDGWVYIKDGKLVDEWEESGGSHSWFRNTVLRKPTKQDKIVLELIDKIGDE